MCHGKRKIDDNTVCVDEKEVKQFWDIFSINLSIPNAISHLNLPSNKFRRRFGVTRNTSTQIVAYEDMAIVYHTYNYTF